MEKTTHKGFSFVPQVLSLYAVMVIFQVVLTSLVGDGAKSLSTLYQLGSKGVALATLLQYLLCSAAIITLRTLFISEKVIKKMMTIWRRVLLLICVLIILSVFIVVFRWFEIGNIYCWIGFFICFGGSFLLSILYMVIRTNIEDKKYGDLLASYKKQHGGGDDNE